MKVVGITQRSRGRPTPTEPSVPAIRGELKPFVRRAEEHAAPGGEDAMYVGEHRERMVEDLDDVPERHHVEALGLERRPVRDRIQTALTRLAGRALGNVDAGRLPAA